MGAQRLADSKLRIDEVALKVSCASVVDCVFVQGKDSRRGDRILRSAAFGIDVSQDTDLCSLVL